MLTDSDVFVWEVPGHSGGHLSREVSQQLLSCLRRAEAPLRLSLLGTMLVAYTSALWIFQQPLLETLAAQDLERAWLAVGLLLGLSTLVLAPLFGLLAQSRAEARLLLEAGRYFPVTSVQTRGAESTTLTFTTREGERQVQVEGTSLIPNHGCGIYAVPEELRVVVVRWNGPSGPEHAVGRLCRPSATQKPALHP